MLPSTSGGHDPISTARGCDRCFLPGLALDWGRCAKAREEATQGEGEPQNRGSPAVSQPTAGAVQVPPREARGGRMHSFAYSHTGPAGRPRRGQSGDLGARGKNQTRRLGTGARGEAGKLRAAKAARAPSHTHSTEPTPVHALPSSPTAVTPLPRARRYLWGSRPAAASRAGVPLPALQPPLRRRLRLGAGPWGRGHRGGGAGPGAGWAGSAGRS